MLALLEIVFQTTPPFYQSANTEDGLPKTPISHLVPRPIPSGRTLTHAEVSKLTEVQRLALRHAEERAATEARRARAAEQVAERHLQKAELAARQGDAFAARSALRRARGSLVDVARGLSAAQSDVRLAPTGTTKLIEQRIESTARRVERFVRETEQRAAEAEARDRRAGMPGRVGSAPSLSILI